MQEIKQEVVKVDQGKLNIIRPVDDQESEQDRAQRLTRDLLLEIMDKHMYAAFHGFTYGAKPDTQGDIYARPEKMPEPKEEIMKRLYTRGIREDRKGGK